MMRMNGKEQWNEKRYERMKKIRGWRKNGKRKEKMKNGKTTLLFHDSCVSSRVIIYNT